MNTPTVQMLEDFYSGVMTVEPSPSLAHALGQ